MTKSIFIFFIFLLSFALVSCGGGDDGGGGGGGQSEESGGTTGGTAGGSTGGTSGGTAGGTAGGTTGGTPEPSCMSNSQRESIMNFFNRASELGSFDGVATITSSAPGDTTTTSDAIVRYDFVKNSETSWTLVQTCTLGCISAQFPVEIVNGCFAYRGQETDIQSASDTAINFTTQDDIGNTTDNLRLINDSFSYRSVLLLNNGRQTITNFAEQ